MGDKQYIYLDYAASASNAKFSVPDGFANPNSVHDAGRESFSALEQAREKMAVALGAKRPTEIIFTSGATESNNSAIFGIARAAAKNATERSNLSRPKSTTETQNLSNFKSTTESSFLGKKPRVIVSAIEHESLLMPAQALKDEGFDVFVIPVDKCGFVNSKSLEAAITPETVLVSIQAANTEMGAIQNIAELAKVSHQAGAYFHTDAVGVFGKIPFSVAQCGVDACSISGHKFGAPKGVGALYLKAKTPFRPLILGSGQEGGMRSGTQNVAAVQAMANAAEKALVDLPENMRKLIQLRNYLYCELCKFDKIHPSVALFENATESANLENNLKTATPDRYLPHIVNVHVDGFESETLVILYNKFGIEVAGGPACSSEKKEPSHTLMQLGLSQKEAGEAMRISMWPETTKSDIDKLLLATREIINNSC